MRWDDAIAESHFRAIAAPEVRGVRGRVIERQKPAAGAPQGAVQRGSGYDLLLQIRAIDGLPHMAADLAVWPRQNP